MRGERVPVGDEDEDDDSRDDSMDGILGMEKERDENSEEILFDNVYELYEVIGK